MQKKDHKSNAKPGVDANLVNCSCKSWKISGPPACSWKLSDRVRNFSAMLQLPQRPSPSFWLSLVASTNQGEQQSIRMGTKPFVCPHCPPFVIPKNCTSSFKVLAKFPVPKNCWCRRNNRSSKGSHQLVAGQGCFGGSMFPLWELHRLQTWAARLLESCHSKSECCEMILYPVPTAQPRTWWVLAVERLDNAESQRLSVAPFTRGLGLFNHAWQVHKSSTLR